MTGIDGVDGANMKAYARPKGVVRVVNDFYEAVAQLSGTFLGLWWTVIGLKGDTWRRHPGRYRLLVHVASHLAMLGTMSLLALLGGVVDAGLLWRVAFALIGLAGLLEALEFLRTPSVPVVHWAVLRPLRAVAPALYVAIIAVAVTPAALWPLAPLQLEGVLVTLVLVRTLPFVWGTFIEAPEAAPKPAPPM